MNLASAVTRAVIKEVDLPESLIRWMYHFIRIEQETGFKAFDIFKHPETFSPSYQKEYRQLEVKEREEKAPLQKQPNYYDNIKFKRIHKKYVKLHEDLEIRYNIFTRKNPYTPEELLIPYTLFFLALFHSIPPIRERYEGDITASIGLLKPEPMKLPYDVPAHHLDAVQHIVLPNHFYQHEVDIDIPNRFEHTHIIGATGSGKTVLLKHLIFKDTKKDAAVVAMAPKGDLIPFLLSCPIPEDRIVLIRPKDNIKLNLFSIGSVDLINYVISSLLDAETTPRQTGLLNYCIRLCLKIPGASIRTLYEILDSETLPAKYSEYVNQLSDAAQDFFTKKFGEKGRSSYASTKQEIGWRIDALLNNEYVERVFCQAETNIHFQDALESGKVILIDTSIESLGESGSKFFGRFFIALLNRASQRRTTDVPVYAYLDEAADYLDSSVENILEKAREAKIGITLAHQQLAQLGDLAPTVMTNTRTKFVGGCSQDDARRMGKEIYADPDDLARQHTFEFTVKCRGIQALHTTYPPKYINSLPKRDTTHFDAPAVEYPVNVPPELRMVAENKKNYDSPQDDIDTWHDP